MKRLIAFLIFLVGFLAWSPPDQQVQAAPSQGIYFVADLPSQSIVPFVQDDTGGVVGPGVVEETPAISEEDENIIVSVFFFLYDFVIERYPKVAVILSIVFAFLWLISEALAESKYAKNSIFQVIRSVIRKIRNKSPTTK